MPTLKTRMALTLTDELRDALADLGEATGRPMATVAVQLLGDLVPQLHSLAKVARANKLGDKVEAQRALIHMVGDQMAEVLASIQPDMFPTRPTRRPRKPSKMGGAG
jgi:hypothetical protein